MNELRREMLDSSDAPPELSPELKFLASRQASLGALLLDHAEHYTVLYTAVRQHGSSEEIQTAALDAAGNLGTVLQSLRSREDLQQALAHAPGYTPTPLIAIDQLFFSFTLLAGTGAGTGGDAPDNLDAALPPEGVDELFRSQHVRDWLHGLGELAPGE
jgi:hypothetical protein